MDFREHLADVEYHFVNRLVADYNGCSQQNQQAIRRITQCLCRGMRAEGTVEFTNGIPPVINDGEIVDAISAAADQVLGPGHTVWEPFPSMGSDDFSVFLDYSRGCQFFVGSANEDPQTQIGLHRGENIFDTKSLLTGTGVLTQYIINALGRS